jgi:hypothetical protein
MRAITLVLYGVGGALAVLAGLVAVAAPRMILSGAEITPLAAHLIQEEGATFVFIGSMLLWCTRHFERRRPVHLAMVVLTALFAVIHWMGYVRHPEYIAPALVNTVPFVLFALTAPFRVASEPAARFEPTARV